MKLLIILIAPTKNTPSIHEPNHGPGHRSKAKNAYPTACSAKRFNLRLPNSQAVGMFCYPKRRWHQDGLNLKLPGCLSVSQIQLGQGRVLFDNFIVILHTTYLSCWKLALAAKLMVETEHIQWKAYIKSDGVNSEAFYVSVGHWNIRTKISPIMRFWRQNWVVFHH